MTVFKEENKGKRSRPNREVIIYSLLRTFVQNSLIPL